LEGVLANLLSLKLPMPLNAYQFLLENLEPLNHVVMDNLFRLMVRKGSNALKLLESDQIGDISVYSLVNSNHGMYYEAVHVLSSKVTLKVPTVTLHCYAQHQQENVPLLCQVLNRLILGGQSVIKEVETLLPMVDILRARYLGDDAVSGRVKCSLVWPKFIGSAGSENLSFSASAVAYCCTHEPMMLDEHRPVTEATGDELVRKAYNDNTSEIAFAFPRCVTYPAIEGIVTNLFGPGVHSVVQMKMHKELTSSKIVKYLDSMHNRVTNTLSLKGRVHWAILYTTANLSDEQANNLRESMPANSIVLLGEVLLRVLEPFGCTPVSQAIQLKQSAVKH